MIRLVTDAVRQTAASVALKSAPASLLGLMLPTIPSELLATSLRVAPGGLRVATHGLSAKGGLPWSVLDQVYPRGGRSLLGEFRSFVERKAPARGWFPRVILSQATGVACDPAQTPSRSFLRDPTERAAWEAITLPQSRTQHDTIPMHVLASVAASVGLPTPQAATDWAVGRLLDLCRTWANAAAPRPCVVCDAGNEAIDAFSLEQLEQVVELAREGRLGLCASHHDLITSRCWRAP